MLNQTIVNHADCGPFWENQITDRMFCVSAVFYDSCDGDSGVGFEFYNFEISIVLNYIFSLEFYDLTESAKLVT